jgi:hypothetical protein
MVSRKAGRIIIKTFMHEVHTKIFSFSLLIFNLYRYVRRNNNGSDCYSSN